LLNKEGSRAVIEGNTIVYKQIGLTEEEKRQYGRKQSLLDDPKMFYFYSENGEYYHDKECQEIKGIMPEDFQGSDTIPDNKEICPKCRRKIYFRKATYPNTKQSSICNRIF
jgi:hypothetical protein